MKWFGDKGLQGGAVCLRSALNRRDALKPSNEARGGAARVSRPNGPFRLKRNTLMGMYYRSCRAQYTVAQNLYLGEVAMLAERRLL